MEENQSQLKIVSLINMAKIDNWNAITTAWERYFLVNHIIDKPQNIKQYLNQKIDFLFLDFESLQFFKQNFYEIFKQQNANFHYIVIKNNFDVEQEVKIFKSLADDIIHLDKDIRWLKWKTVALLRRHWDTHSKSTTIIYKNIIADFIDGFISIEGQTINLTPKELKLFRYLLENRGQYKSRDDIFQVIWKYDGIDNTRVVDQIMFKVRKKIGHDYFKNDRKEGIKFE